MNSSERKDHNEMHFILRNILGPEDSNVNVCAKCAEASIYE